MQKRGIFYTLPYLAFHNQNWRFIMKVTVFVCVGILVSAQLLLATPGFSQNYEQKIISLHYSDAPIRTIFRAIEKKADVVIMYLATDDIKKEKASISTDGKTVAEVLDQLLKPEGISWAIRDNVIRLYRKKDNSSRTNSPQPTNSNQKEQIKSQQPITGRVTDTTGAPLAGASVRLKGSNKGTNTNANGEFTIDAHPGDVLVISFVGYQNREVSVGNNNLTVVLKTAESALDEIQVIAYGQTTKRLQTGNVSTVKAKDIENQPVNNPLLALQGRVPGLFINQNTGIAGGGATIRIQGQNSIANGSDPFYVIDGVPLTSQLPRTGLANMLLGNSGGLINGITTGVGNPLSFINPADIESIEILKDADATAIYGSRAANGAILITTKKGQIGKVKVNINMQTGWGKVTRELEMLNTAQYLEMRKEAKKNDNLSNNSSDYDINGLWDTTRNTNWQKELIGNTSQYNDAQVSISGGNAQLRYLVGSGYHQETSVFPGKFSDKKASLHFNISSNSRNQKFNFQLTGNYLVDNNKLPSTDLTQDAINMAPDAPSPFNADGSLNWQPNAAGNSTWDNPLKYLYQTYRNETKNLIANATLSYKILPGLRIKSSFGYNDIETNEFQVNPLTTVKPELRPTTERTAAYGARNLNSWIIEPQLLYNKNIGGGKLDILVGSTIQQNKSNGNLIAGIGYNSDEVLEDISAASSIQAQSSFATEYKYAGLFSRINYNLLDKYIINITARRDGSSRFGVENQYHNFGSLGSAWIFSSESWFEHNIPFISFGKLRGSYGITGNDQIADYQFLHLYNPISAGVAYQGSRGVSPASLSNPYLQWEETKKLQIGIDLAFLKDRLLLSSTYSRNRSSNQLLSTILPAYTGFDNIIANFPATVQNVTWELNINSKIIANKNFTWNANLNITVPQNELVAFSGLENSAYSNTLIIGEPLSINKLYHFHGVDPTTGLYTFLDSHGSSTTTPDFLADRTELISTSPKYYGGIQNSVSYKGFQLDLLVQFVNQIGRNNNFSTGGTSVPGRFVSTRGWGNQPATVIQRWRSQGDIAAIQRYGTGLSLQSPIGKAIGSDAGYTDASYLRLKNISLSWNFPDYWIRKLNIENCRVFIHSQNLLTITNYKGLDPENQTISSLPPLKIITVGLNIGL